MGGKVASQLRKCAGGNVRTCLFTFAMSGAEASLIALLVFIAAFLLGPPRPRIVCPRLQIVNGGPPAATPSSDSAFSGTSPVSTMYGRIACLPDLGQTTIRPIHPRPASAHGSRKPCDYPSQLSNGGCLVNLLDMPRLRSRT